ncbi:MAG TPA: capsule assembly Wzi family protein [Armatimonadota bacterium]|jgi:hypothetical protein
MRHHGILRILAIAILYPFFAAPGHTEGSNASITSMPAADTAVIGAGANAGLTVGQELPVLHSGVKVGSIVLTKVENESATGRVSTVEGATVQVLDDVQLPSADQLPVSAPKTNPPREAPRAPAATHGSYNEHLMDIIPWERWEYMALSSLAVDGLLPGYAARDFQATRQFTRGELGGLTAQALLLYTSGMGTDRDPALLRRLAGSFRYDPAVQQAVEAALEITLDHPAKPTLVPEAPGLSAYGGLRYWRFRGESKVNVTGRVGGIYDVNDNVFLALSVNNLHQLTSSLPKAFPAIDVATANFRGLGMDWEVGKTYLSSGPLASGDGLLSDNSPGMVMVKARGAFKWGPLGRFIGTQVYGGFRDLDGPKYFGFRRMESRINKRLELGLGEAYISTHAPNPLSLVMPFYAYQRLVINRSRLGGHSTSSAGNDTFNYMAQVDLVAHLNRKADAYGELILDDISAPSGLGVGNVPRKLAYVFGMRFPELFGKRGDGRFEIYSADRETYMGIVPQVGWTNKDLLIGNPFGPNTQAFFGRLDYRFTDKTKGSLQLRDAVQYHNGLPDMGDRFEFAVTLAHDITPAESISVQIIPQRFRGQGYTQRPNAFELMGTYAY